jgi:hypothetical protein
VYWSDARAGAIHRLAAVAEAPVAIEYFNASLGHYFLTAFAEKRPALDIGAFAGRVEAHRVRVPGVDPADVRHGRRVPLLRHARRRPEHALLHRPCAGMRGPARESAVDLRRRCVSHAAARRRRLPAPTRPVYRLYNNPATVAAVNHRYTADGATYAAMRASGLDRRGCCVLRELAGARSGSIETAEALVKVTAPPPASRLSAVSRLSVQERLSCAVRPLVQRSADFVCAMPRPVFGQEIGRQQRVMQRDASQVVDQQRAKRKRVLRRHGSKSSTTSAMGWKRDRKDIYPAARLSRFQPSRTK